jgi:hypothetical protein
VLNNQPVIWRKKSKVPHSFDQGLFQMAQIFNENLKSLKDSLSKYWYKLAKRKAFFNFS